MTQTPDSNTRNEIDPEFLRIIKENNIRTRSICLAALKQALLDLTNNQGWFLEKGNEKTESKLQILKLCTDDICANILRLLQNAFAKELIGGVLPEKIKGVDQKWIGINSTYIAPTKADDPDSVIIGFADIDQFVASQVEILKSETDADPSLQPFVAQSDLWEYRLGDPAPLPVVAPQLRM